MHYLKWKLSNGVSGTGPEETIAGRGGLADASGFVDADGYRLGYLTQTADLTGLETWDVSTLTESQALAFAQGFYAEAAVMGDGRISGPPPEEPPV